jgi:hypothetical protein
MIEEDKNNTVTLKLTVKQANLILESLLYAGSINIGASWEESVCEQIVQTAVRIKEQIGDDNTQFNNLTYFEDEGFEDALTDKIRDSFNIELFNVKSINAI